MTSAGLLETRPAAVAQQLAIIPVKENDRHWRLHKAPEP